MNRATHEQLIQVLSAISIQISALQTQVGDGSQQQITDARTLHAGLTQSAQMVHDALYLARSEQAEETLPELEDSTLANALSLLIDQTAEQLNLSSRVSFSGVDEQGCSKEHTLSPVADRVLFLTARETLYNVRQHTGAHLLRMRLHYTQDDVQMSIENDGIFIGPTIEASNIQQSPESEAALPLPLSSSMASREQEERYEHSTPSIMLDLRTRIEQLGGTFSEQHDAQGTHTLVHIPYIVQTHSTSKTPLVSYTAQSAKAPVPEKFTQVSVLVVEPQAVTRAGLRRLLDSYSDLRVVGEAADGVQAVSETLELGPQVVLMDAHLPNGQSIETLRQIKQLNLETRVLLLSTQEREEYLYETLRAGADGYVLKDIAPDELARAIRTVARGEVLVQAQLAGRLLSRFGKQGKGNIPFETLTARELEVLRLLARGLRNKEIAARLFVSERTINFHLANIYQKLNVSGRTEALSKGLEQGLIST